MRLMPTHSFATSRISPKPSSATTSSTAIPAARLSTRSNTKLFFFFNFEGTRATRPFGPAFVDVYHPDLLNGDFSRLLRFNATTGAPTTIVTDGINTGLNTGTVFQPGSITRNAAG